VVVVGVWRSGDGAVPISAARADARHGRWYGSRLRLGAGHGRLTAFTSFLGRDAELSAFDYLITH
jgi:hypothetical protein